MIICLREFKKDKKTNMKLRLILGDQLNYNHSWLSTSDEQTVYFMAEMRQETDYVKHHIQKVVAFFLSMRSFAQKQIENGHRVIYYQLDNPDNLHSLVANIKSVIDKEGVTSFEYQLPDEYRLDQQLSQLAESLDIPVKACDTEHFLSERGDLATFFEGKKTYLMESFYRMMRKKYDIMMDGVQPITGKWNYDADNRKKLPKKHIVPAEKSFAQEVADIVVMIDESGVAYFGNIDTDKFVWATTREQALEQLEHFNKTFLQDFGNYQDAMHTDEWSLYHCRLSFAMNAKILSPLEVIESVVTEWHSRPDDISIAQVEGFVRQILGWREYMRGVYWAHMPEYASHNFFEHKRSLPSWFWTGETKMNCLSHAIKQSLDYSYAHHIQRLMITGNFALLAGIDPDEVDQWYLGIYIDAIEWVEITNTRGMSQFADGGIVGTKPYVSSANYIHKMSNYCNSCHYDRKVRVGDKACPFNSLYWNFYDQHTDKLSKNPRIGMMYRLWARMKSEDKTALLEQASYYLDRIDEL